MNRFSSLVIAVVLIVASLSTGCHRAKAKEEPIKDGALIKFANGQVVLVTHVTYVLSPPVLYDVDVTPCMGKGCFARMIAGDVLGNTPHDVFHYGETGYDAAFDQFNHQKPDAK